MATLAVGFPQQPVPPCHGPQATPTPASLVWRPGADEGSQPTSPRGEDGGHGGGAGRARRKVAWSQEVQEVRGARACPSLTFYLPWSVQGLLGQAGNGATPGSTGSSAVQTDAWAGLALCSRAGSVRVGQRLPPSPGSKLNKNRVS